MELSEYIKLLYDFRYWIIGWVLVCILFGVGFSLYKGTQYRASVDFMVGVAGRGGADKYHYDGYYAIRAGDYVAKTISSWFKTPSFVLNLYDTSQITRPKIRSLNAFSRIFKPTQYSAQNVVVRFSRRRSDEAQKLAQAIITNVENKSLLLNQDLEGNSLFKVKGSVPVILEIKPNYFLFGLVAGVSGLLVALALLPIKFYLAAKPKGFF